MKKSLLVVPALGVMLLAAAGSVGGTVAWFTSASSVNAAVGTFQAKALEGNLTLDVKANTAAGTQQGPKGNASNTDYTSVHMTEGDFLTHASYDHLTGDIFTRSSESKGGVRKVFDASEQNQSYVAKADYDGTGNDEKHDIYWAVSWDLEFSYVFATEKAANLYFDATKSEITQGTTANQRETYKGFRIAFKAETYVDSNSFTSQNNIVASSTRVWAPYRTLAEATAPNVQAHYINDADVTDLALNNTTYYLNGSNYSANLIDSAVKAAGKRPEGTPIEDDDWDEESAKADFIGQFKTQQAGGASKIKVTCIAWFEGTDPTVVNNDDKVMDLVSASLVFYTREADVAHNG